MWQVQTKCKALEFWKGRLQQHYVSPFMIEFGFLQIDELISIFNMCLKLILKSLLLILNFNSWPLILILEPWKCLMFWTNNMLPNGWMIVLELINSEDEIRISKLFETFLLLILNFKQQYFFYFHLGIWKYCDIWNCEIMRIHMQPKQFKFGIIFKKLFPFHLSLENHRLSNFS